MGDEMKRTLIVGALVLAAGCTPEGTLTPHDPDMPVAVQLILEMFFLAAGALFWGVIGMLVLMGIGHDPEDEIDYLAATIVWPILALKWLAIDVTPKVPGFLHALAIAIGRQVGRKP